MSRTRSQSSSAKIFDRRVRADNAGIVDQDVEATQLVGNLGKGPVNRSGLGHIDGKADGRTAYFSSRPLRAIDVDI